MGAAGQEDTGPHGWTSRSTPSGTGHGQWRQTAGERARHAHTHGQSNIKQSALIFIPEELFSGLIVHVNKAAMLCGWVRQLSAQRWWECAHTVLQNSICVPAPLCTMGQDVERQKQDILQPLKLWFAWKKHFYTKNEQGTVSAVVCKKDSQGPCWLFRRYSALEDEREEGTFSILIYWSSYYLLFIITYYLLWCNL